MSGAVRSLRWFALGLLAVLALAVALIAFAVGTTPGGRVVLDLFAPDELTVESLDGHLGGDLRIVGLRHEGDRAEVRIEELRVRWSPRSLLGRAFVVERLRAEGVSVRLRPPPEPDPEPRDALPQLRLPVRVQIDSALLADVEVHPPPREPGGEPALEEPVRVDRLVLLEGTVSREGRIDLRAAARAPEAQPELDVRAGLRGRLTARGDYPLDLRVDWSARRPGDPPLAGAGRLTGDLARLQLEHTLRRPTAARLEGRVRDLLGDDLAWEGVLEVPRFRMATVRAEWPTHGLEARVQAEGGRHWVRGRASARLLPEAGGEMTAWLAGRYEDERVRLDSLVLGAPPTEGRLVARGEIALGGRRPEFRLRGAWSDVAWPPVSPAAETGEAPVVRSPDGSFRLEGTMAAYDLSLRARVDGPRVPRGDWSLEAAGDTAGLAVRALRGRTMDGEVRATGRVAWAPRARWRLALEAEGLRTESLAAGWPGEVSARLRTEGAAGDGGRTAALEVTELSGELRGEPLEGRLSARLEGERVTAEALRLSLGDAELEGSGVVGTSWDVEWSLRVPDLSVLALDTIRPDLGGAVRAEGTVTGRRRAPAVAMDLEADALESRQVRIDRLEGDVAVDLSGQTASSVSLVAEGIEGEERHAPWLSLERAALSGEGTPDDHRLTLDVGTSVDSFRVVLAGGLVESERTAPPGRAPEAVPLEAAREVEGVPLDGRGLAWTGSMAELALRTPRSEWALRAPGRLRAGADAIRLEELCWEGRMAEPEEPDARLCASGAWARGAGGTTELEAAALPLALLRPFLPPDMEVSGTISGRLAGSADPGAELRGMADLRAGPGELRYEAAPGQRVTRPYEELSLDARIEGGELAASLALTMDGGTAEGEVRVPVGATDGSRSLDGTLRGRFEDRGLAGALTLDLDETAGTLTADLTLGGTLREPRALGELELAGARAHLLPFGLLLEDVRLRGESDQADRWTLSGSAASGQGTLEMDGTASLGVDAPWETDLTFRGERFEAYNTAHASVVVTPDLRARGDPEGILVTGEVHIPEARIAPQDLQLMAIEPSEDVVLVGPEGTEEEPAEELERSVPVPIQAEVRLTTGDSVHLDAFGVEGRLEGSLRVSYASGRPTRASGELDVVEGTYTSYYQELAIERGRLVFADATLGNPGLDIRVSRQPREEILVGLEIGGTAREPSATLFSEPAMPQAEALSWLVLGRSLSRAESEDGELLTSAARSAGLAGGEFLAARLAAAFGLEEARVERGADGASFILGARLAPNLYVAYTIGLFDEGDILQVRYDFGRWTLSTQTGFETAADILYRAGGEEEGSPDLAPPGLGDEAAVEDGGR